MSRVIGKRVVDVVLMLLMVNIIININQFNDTSIKIKIIRNLLLPVYVTMACQLVLVLTDNTQKNALNASMVFSSNVVPLILVAACLVQTTRLNTYSMTNVEYQFSTINKIFIASFVLYFVSYFAAAVMKVLSFIGDN